VAITVGVLVVVVAMMVPVTDRARSYYHLMNAADEITSELEFARSEAVKRDDRATVTFTTTGAYTVTFAGTTVTHYLPPGVSLVVASGVAPPRVEFLSSGKVNLTPSGASIVLENAAGRRTLQISVAGNITRS
jgi:hypothetical protein